MRMMSHLRKGERLQGCAALFVPAHEGNLLLNSE